MVLREVVTRLGYNVDETNLNAYKAQLGEVSQQAMKYGREMQMMGAKLSLALTLPITLAGRAMIKSASEAQETEGKFTAVYNNLRGEASATAKSFAEDFDLANSTAQKYLSATGDMLTGFGFSQKDALAMSDRVNRLAVDLASFQNLEGGAERASRALTSGLLGEREAMKSLGIAILEKDVKERVALLASQGMTFATERQAKAYATLTLATEQSKNAIGDYARTREGYANSERRFMEARKAMAEEWGKILLPLATKVMDFFTFMTKQFRRSDDATKRFILTMGGFTALIPILLTGLGTISGFFAGGRGIVAGLSMLKTLGATMLLPFLGLLAVIGLIYLIFDEIITWLNGGDSVIGNFLDADEYKRAWADIMDYFKSYADMTGKEIAKSLAFVITDTMLETIKALTLKPMAFLASKIYGDDYSEEDFSRDFGTVIDEMKSIMGIQGVDLVNVTPQTFGMGGGSSATSTQAQAQQVARNNKFGIDDLFFNNLLTVLSEKGKTEYGDRLQNLTINIDSFKGNEEALVAEIIRQVGYSTDALSNMEMLGISPDADPYDNILVNP